MSENQSSYAERQPDRLRLLTLNLYGRNSSADPANSWEARRPVLQAGFRALAPDLVALQESIVTPDYDQALDLLGPAYHIVHQKRRNADGMGISIASLWPLENVQEVDLHLTPRTRATDFPCGALVAEILLPDPFGKLLFVNHFPDWQLDHAFERELQTLEVARYIEQNIGQTNGHVVVAGDLDAAPEAASIRFWSGHQALGDLSVCYRDAWEGVHPGAAGHTFTPENGLMAEKNWDWPFKRIDYIFVRYGAHGGPTLKIEACRRIFDTPVNGVWASDHFGLVADLTIPPRL